MINRIEQRKVVALANDMLELILTDSYQNESAKLETKYRTSVDEELWRMGFRKTILWLRGIGDVENIKLNLKLMLINRVNGENPDEVKPFITEVALKRFYV
jgi:hypothetical protein